MNGSQQFASRQLSRLGLDGLAPDCRLRALESQHQFCAKNAS